MVGKLNLPYLDSLNLPDLTKLTNDLILHNLAWPNMPTKLPSYIPKFDGKPGEDPTNHIMTFHLWCSSNNIIDDSIHLQLFQRTLTSQSMKWYIDEKISGSHATFTSLAKGFFILFSITSTAMTLAWKSSQIYAKPLLLISQITSMNGIEDKACVKLKPP
jgi:hypothetical protein